MSSRNVVSSLRVDHKTLAAANPFLKAGSVLFALWGLLHVYVGFMGLSLIKSPNAGRGFFNLMIGGSAAPMASFPFPTDPTVLKVVANFGLNFTNNVAGYGVMGLLVSWLLWHRKSVWLAFFMGTILVGLADLSFLFLQVVPGHIALTWETISGPIIWFLAVIVTCFGLPKYDKTAEDLRL